MRRRTALTAAIVLLGTAAAGVARGQERDAFDAIREQEELRMRQASQTSRAQARASDPYTINVDGGGPKAATAPSTSAAPTEPHKRGGSGIGVWLLAGGVLVTGVLFWALRERAPDGSSRWRGVRRP